MEEGQIESALSDLREASEGEDQRAQALRAIGILRFRQQNYEEAIRTFNDALDAAANERAGDDFVADTAFYLAESYSKTGNDDKALGLYKKLLHGNSAKDAYVLMGGILLKQDKREEAAEAFQRATKNGANMDLYLQIYSAYNAVDLQADAARFLAKAPFDAASDPEEIFSAARGYYLLGDYDAAISVLKSAGEDKKKAETEDKLESLLLKCYLDKGNREEATAYFEELRSSDQKAAYGACGLALLSMEHQDFDQAEKQIKEALRSAKGTLRASLLFNEMICAEKSGDFVQAKKRAEAAHEEFPENEAITHENEFLSSR